MFTKEKNILTKEEVVEEALEYFVNTNQDIHAQTGQYPVFFAVHIRPKKSVILAIPRYMRLQYVEDLIERVMRKVQSNLFRRPTRPHTFPRHIKHKNCIESHTKCGSTDIHHSHGVWLIHPDVIDKFLSLLIPFDVSLIKEHERDSYSDRNIFTFNDAIMNPLRNEVHTIMIEKCYGVVECYDLEKSREFKNILDYCAKNIEKINGLHWSATYQPPSSPVNSKDSKPMIDTRQLFNLKYYRKNKNDLYI